MHTIIYLPCFDYFLHRQRPQHLLWGLSRLGFRVIYCQPTGHRGVWQVVAGLAENRHPLGPLIPLSDTFFLCNDMNAIDLSAPHIMWLTHGPYAGKMSEWGFRPALVVSDFADACVEEFQEFAPYERDKLACADIALAASRGVFDDLKDRHPNLHLVPNAADFELFSMACDPAYDLPCPLEIATILGTGAYQGGGMQPGVPPGVSSKKLIGFWGAVTTWVDLDLVVRIAVRRPNWHFIFIGYIGLKPGLLPRLSNITFIGDRDYLSLPFYARWFDAAIIPFEVREVTRKACPIKAYEYLAAGLPTVATELPEIKGLGDIRVIAQGRDLVSDFIAALEWAVNEGKHPGAVEARLNAVKNETWTNRTRLVADLIGARISA